jgi:hypothetical protein
MCSHRNRYECFYCQPIPGGFIMSRNCRKKYGLFNFLFDLFMCFITGGLWLIWIFVREMRNR